MAQPSKNGRWSVIVWAAVTSDLEDAIDDDIREAGTALEAMGAGDGIHLHVFLTGPSRDAYRRAGRPTVHSWPKADGGLPDDPSSPREVLERTDCWADDTRNRMLVLWGHGARAFPTISQEDLDSLRSRTRAPDPLTDRLASNVPTAGRLIANISPFGANPLKPPDIIGYDACRMATLTTVLTLAECFPDAYFIGSTVPEPATGWPYFQIMQILGTGWGLDAVATALVEAYAASVDSGDWCMVALNFALAQTDREHGRPGLRQELDKLLASRPPSAVDFYSAAQSADLLDDTNLADLGALLRRMERNGSPAKAKNLRTALLQSIITRRSAGSLSGRDGVGVRVGLPIGARDPGDDPWPLDRPPGWNHLFPQVLPKEPA